MDQGLILLAAWGQLVLQLAWVVVVGVIGIVLFAEMSGRVAAVAGRPVFDLIRERLGPRPALLSLFGSFLVTLLTLTAESGGVVLSLELASNVNYLLWIPGVLFAVWVISWRVRFRHARDRLRPARPPARREVGLVGPTSRRGRE